MFGKRERSDWRLDVARYRVDHADTEAPDDVNSPNHSGANDPGERRQGAPGPGLREPGAGTQAAARDAEPTEEQRANFVEIAIQQAIRRGDFDDLPGSGKPLTGMSGAHERVHDPDWWIKSKIEREKITGLGPPALTLRTENLELDGRLDSTSSEREARRILEDFNTRVIDARWQLHGGPPVVTPTRDVDAEIAEWRERRQLRHLEAERQRDSQAAETAAMTRRQRRQARRRQARGE